MTKDKKREYMAGIVATLIVLGVVGGIMILTGCAARVKTVTDLPAGVTQTQAQQWDTAVANLHKIATVTSTLRTSVIALNKAGTFPDGAAYATALQTIQKIDQIQLAASAVLRQAPQNFDAPTKTKIADYMQQISAQIATLNTQGVTGIKDPAGVQSINSMINDLSAAASLVLAL